LADWLTAAGCTHVAMESTGVYWRPVYNVLEVSFELSLVNAQHVRMVPGRKTDVRDSEWLAQLLELGLLRRSFVPPVAQRELRDVVRYRKRLIEERAREANRVLKVLETANITLGSVVSHVLGVSARAMLKALLAGEGAPAELADLAKRRLRHKRPALTEALTGRVTAHHRFMLAHLLRHIDFLDDTIATYDRHIEMLTAADPSRRSSAPISPACVQRSASRRIPRLYSAVNRRRWAFATTSVSPATGAVLGEAPVALRAPSASPSCSNAAVLARLDSRRRPAHGGGDRRRTRLRHDPVPDRRPCGLPGRASAPATTRVPASG
jgi:hypothetical protein